MGSIATRAREDLSVIRTGSNSQALGYKADNASITDRQTMYKATSDFLLKLGTNIRFTFSELVLSKHDGLSLYSNGPLPAGNLP